jgi:protein subunit release factor B
MANDALINLLVWCQRERERLQMQREMLKSGRFRIFEDDDSGQRDISNQHIEQIGANIAELDRLIAEYKAKGV